VGSRTGFSAEREQAARPIPSKSIVREYTETILICVLILIFPRTFVFQQSEIPSSSMEDTILVGDYILVNRFLYAPTSLDIERKLLPTRDVRRGDVVVFKHPDTPEVDYIKRIVGLPGDRILVRDGSLWVNGKLAEDSFVGPLYRGPEPGGVTFGPIVVREGHYFAMGDHRNASADSRSWGQVPHGLIKGRAFMVLFSTNARPPADEPVGQVSPKSLVRKLVNLVFNARWDRSFTAIR
jgi:signal peptidase I